ncbi:alpha/beta hydrolase [Flammeovirga sp. SubArs3]|uniref:alpha/beta hydrolase n=1 Tax=Flammeovirga sp. SubArs3 TaxID=2995316 RepID=UPI00248CD2B3|nr:alpha/beta hydrolase [Flammeovirga sp. SubArs3]
MMSLLYSTTYGQELIELWDEKDIPNYKSTEEREDIAKRDITFISKVQKPTLEIFLPSERNANGKAILILPGGGYGGVAYDWEGTDYAKWLNAQGIAAFVLKYRSPQAASVIESYKAPIQDAQRAIRWIKRNVQKLHIKKELVGVMGSSAGGHLASTLATHSTSYYEATDEIDKESFQVSFMMLIYPVVSMKKGITHMGSRNNLLGKEPTKQLIEQFSNEEQVTEKTPKAFIVHSADDGAVPVQNSLVLYDALLKNNISTDMHLYPKGGHGYGFGKSNADAPDWTAVAEDWLNSW